MTYRTFDFSSDVGVEGEEASIESALVELARAVCHVITDGSRIEPRDRRSIHVLGAQDWPGTAVAWVNELVFLFDTDQFLVHEASLQLSRGPDGLHRIAGTVGGEVFDPQRHAAGRGVKAATFHGASYAQEAGRHRFRLVLDL